MTRSPFVTDEGEPGDIDVVLADELKRRCLTAIAAIAAELDRRIPIPG